MLKKWLALLRRWLTPERGEINTLFFFGFLVFLSVITLSHFFFWKTPLTGIPLFFCLHAIGQCLIEGGLLLLVGFLLKRWMRRWMFHMFIGFSFALLLVHGANFKLVTLMDVSVAYIYQCFFGSGFAHMITTFQALNMSWGTIVLFVVSLIVIPLIGILLYKATEPLSQKISWKPSIFRLTCTLFATGGTLFILDLVVHPFMTPISYHKFQKALPLGTTFLSPQAIFLPLPKTIGKAREEKKSHQNLEGKKLFAKELPNIYLFVIETLRKDFVTAETAPHLTAFAKENISLESSFSNANATQLSWFAIFHANFPYHWTEMKNSWAHGSLPLHALKKLGYKIRIYSSADLTYFKMDQLIFGKNRQLIDHLFDWSQIRFIEPCERDQRNLRTVLKHLEAPENQTGNLYLVFLDATHSEYSVPQDFPIPFQPTIHEIDYLTLTPDTIEPLKNRYRNAIFYVDSLMGEFFKKMRQKDLYSKAIITITGDHGEEFFEDGALFHGTHLNHYQTSIPLFYKFGESPVRPVDTCTTHLDIFPSILHHLTGRSDFADLFDGQSLFAQDRWPYRIAVLQNGPKTPSEFTISCKDEQFQFRFPDTKHIYETQKLEILKADTPIPKTFRLHRLLGPLLRD